MTERTNRDLLKEQYDGKNVTVYTESGRILKGKADITKDQILLKQPNGKDTVVNRRYVISVTKMF